jgi:hypothetical protein
MSRAWTFAFLLLAAALPARAQSDEGAVLVQASAVQADVERLHDAVASPSSGENGVHASAAAFFDRLQGRTPAFRPHDRPMDREPVDGHVGSIDGMLDEAKKRWDVYKQTHVPDERLDEAVKYAKSLHGAKLLQFDPKLPENQMGEFRYAKDKPDDPGAIKLNARLALLATNIGEAFAYATVIHEAGHAKAWKDGRLKPETTIDNEVEAYKVQYQWLKVIDPSRDRLVVLHSTIKLHLELHPEDRVARLSLDYVAHLLQVWDTKGEDAALKEMIKKLGYTNDGGVAPGATPIRA